eukprot:2654797-Pyramimonas_sp.AAC.1
MADPVEEKPATVKKGEKAKEVKRGSKKHVKKDMQLMRTRKDDELDDREKLRLPESIRRHLDQRTRAEETAAVP